MPRSLAPALDGTDLQTQMTPPRIYCDFNKRIGADTYGLNTLGTRDSLQREGVILKAGLPIVVYMEDQAADGTASWLVADAVVVQDEAGKFVAKVAENSFRNEPAA